MAFTYNLSATVAAELRISKVRLLIPDNVEATAELTDAEITYFLTERGNNLTAAAVDCCKHLARKYAKQFSFTADGVRADLGQRAEMMAARAKELERSLTGGMSSGTLDRQDGYHDEATDGEYESRTVYIKV